MSLYHAEDYPELAKMSRVREASQAIGEFIETSGLVLSEWVEVEGYRDPHLMPISLSIEQVLAKYFDIDLNKVEKERRAILRDIQK